MLHVHSSRCELSARLGATFYLTNIIAGPYAISFTVHGEKLQVSQQAEYRVSPANWII